MKEARRLADMGVTKYAGLTTATRSGPVWNGQVRLHDGPIDQPLRWKEPRRIFVNSMSDLFHEDLLDEAIDRVFAIMALAPQHIFQVLTKRTGRMRDYIQSSIDRFHASAQWRDDMQNLAVELTGSPCAASTFEDVDWPLSNVWLGVSVEDQKRADERIPDLLATPAAVRFLSCEPLLGPVNIGPWHLTPANGHRARIDWLIVGGESGRDARPMHPDWARSLRDQCASASVPFFFKQWGEWTPGENANFAATRTERTATLSDDGWHFDRLTPAQSSELHTDDEPDLYRLGKKRAGRLLDGREWNEFPKPVER